MFLTANKYLVLFGKYSMSNKKKSLSNFPKALSNFPKALSNFRKVLLFQCFPDFILNGIKPREADVLVGLFALGVVDGVGGDAVRLVFTEDVVVLLLRQIVVVAVDVLNHLLPGR